MNSVERVTEYEGQPEEAPATIPGAEPPRDWPPSGALRVRALVVRYRPDLQPVLRGLSFAVRGGEKVGVCGRTGAPSRAQLWDGPWAGARGRSQWRCARGALPDVPTLRALTAAARIGRARGAPGCVCALRA